MMAKTKKATGRIALGKARKTDLRTQFAALCYKMKGGEPRILLVTTRDRGHWMIPKGWPLDGKSPVDTALIEAWEEAGVKGKVTGPCLGLFSYVKEAGRAGTMPCAAMVFPVLVEKMSKKFPEAGQRKRKWMKPKKAASRVKDPDLAKMLRTFEAAPPH